MQRLRTWQLFAICVLVWGTTWHAITYQLSELAPELGVALRCRGWSRLFGLAAPGRRRRRAAVRRGEPAIACAASRCCGDRLRLALEGFRPTVPTIAGAALGVAGNALMLLPGRSDRRLAAAAAAPEAG